MDLLEKVMAESTSESLPLNVEYVGKWHIKCDKQ